jgi:hypothetical protein
VKHEKLNGRRKLRINAGFVFILFAQITSSQVPAYVPALGLSGYWPFTGGAADSTISAHTSTVYGAALTTDRFGNANRAYFFNGSSDYIGTSYQGILGTAQRAVAFWAQTSEAVNAMSAVAWGSIGTASRYEAGFNYGASGAMIDGGNGVITYSTPANVSDNKWHHYVVQFSNNTLSQVQVYQDGILCTTPSNTYNPGNLLNTVSGFNVLFGRIGGSAAHFFSGKLDEIGIWNRPLTLCEINNLYKSSMPVISVTGNAVICPGQSVILTAGGGSTYTWSTGSQAPTVSLTPLSTTQYTVSSTTGAGCIANKTVTVQVSECLGINSVSRNDMVFLYPNPAARIVRISTVESAICTDVYDLSGEWLFHGSAAEIDVSGFATGVYLVKVTTGSDNTFLKLIKQ